MLDIGFRPDIEKILRRCPAVAADAAARAPRSRRRSSGWPSATCASPRCSTSRPRIWRSRRSSSSTSRSIPERKFDLLVRLLEREKPRRRSSSAAPSGAPTRSTSGWRASSRRGDTIHGDLAQNGPRPRDEGLPRGQGPLSGGHRRGGPRHRRDRHLAHHQLRHSRSSATTTSIASAAPAAWAARAWPSPSSRPKKATS